MSNNADGGSRGCESGEDLPFALSEDQLDKAELTGSDSSLHNWCTPPNTPDMNARGKQSKKNQKTGGTTDVSDVCSPQRQRQQLTPQSAGDAASSASATRSAGGRAPASSGSPSPQKRPSYNAAMLAGEMSGLAAITSDGLWEWHTGEEEAEEVKNPLGGREKSTKGSGKLSQSTPGKVNMPQHIGSPPLVAAPVNTRSRAGSHPVPLPPPSPSSTVVAAPDRIQLGFQPPVMTTMEVDQQQHHHQPSSVVETTRSSDLPGSVITTPPHALSATPLKGNERSAPLLSPTPAGTGRLVPTSMGGSARTVQSIEEASRVRENYAPPLPLALTRASGDEHLDFSGTIVMEEAAGGNTFCLDLTSFIRGPQQLQHQQQHQAATAAAKKGGGAHAHEERRGSSSSQFSTISLAGSTDDPFMFAGMRIVEESTENLYADFLKKHTCYDIIPTSTKIVVFDTRLRVKKAFFALVANGVRSAPLWDHSKQDFVGMLTITDFINILRHHYKSPIVGMDELENQTIQMFRDSEKRVASLKPTLLQIDPNQSLYEAVKMLVEHKIHRLPVIDVATGNALFVLTHKRLLHYLFHQLIQNHDCVQPSYMKQSIQELGIGTYQSIATASHDTPVITALNMFHEKRVSALPIVDSLSRKVMDIYAKYDVMNLAAERTYGNLDVTLSKALHHRAQGFEGVHTCKQTDSLHTIVCGIINAKVHRLVVVDKNRCVVGVISLSDILKFLVLTPHDTET